MRWVDLCYLHGFMSLIWIYILVWGKIVATSIVKRTIFIYSHMCISSCIYVNTFLCLILSSNSINTFYQSQLSKILLIKLIENSFLYLIAFLYLITYTLSHRINVSHLLSFSEKNSINFTRLGKINYIDQRLEIKDQFHLNFIIYHVNVTE